MVELVWLSCFSVLECRSWIASTGVPVGWHNDHSLWTVADEDPGLSVFHILTDWRASTDVKEVQWSTRSQDGDVCEQVFSLHSLHEVHHSMAFSYDIYIFLESASTFTEFFVSRTVFMCTYLIWQYCVCVCSEKCQCLCHTWSQERFWSTVSSLGTIRHKTEDTFIVLFL